MGERAFNLWRRFAREPALTAGVPGASRRSRAFKLAGFTLLVGCMALFAGSLVLRSEPVYSPLWDGWVGKLAVLAPTVACLVARSPISATFRSTSSRSTGRSSPTFPRIAAAPRS